MAEAHPASRQFCFRHPTRAAKRRCYHCKRPVCPRCQVKTEGHIFCSQHCAKRHARLRWRGNWARLNKTALQGWWVKGATLLGLLAAGGLAIWLSANFDRFLFAPSSYETGISPPKKRDTGLDREKMNWESEGPVAITSPASGAVLAGGTIVVEGTAPREAMVGLYLNGRPKAVELVPEGRFRFEGVALGERQNILQARFFDNRGNSSFSKAVAVSLKGPAAAPPAASLPEAEPLPPAPALNIVRADTSRREVLLTFDGGSDDNATASILDTLKEHNIHATVFLTGEYIQRYPEMVRRIAAEGHAVGNHTATHPHLTSFSFDGRQATLPGVTKEFLSAQLGRAAALFSAVAGRPMDPFWRAPFGEYNGQILKWAADAGYRHVYWSPRMDTLDWVSDASNPLFRSPDQMLAKLLKQAQGSPEGLNGGIILMHLGTEREGENRADTMLEGLITQLAGEGYSFASVKEASLPK